MGYTRGDDPDLPTVYRKVDTKAGVVLYAFSKEETKADTKSGSQFQGAGVGRGIGHGKMGAITAVPLSQTDINADEAERDWKAV